MCVCVCVCVCSRAQARDRACMCVCTRARATSGGVRTNTWIGSFRILFSLFRLPLPGYRNGGAESDYDDSS